MKKIFVLILFVTSSFILVHCSKKTVDIPTSEPASRAKMISQLVNNQEYMHELMDSISQNTNGMKMWKGNRQMIKNIMRDSTMHYSILGEIMETCKEDSSMCIMLMDKTMGLCDADAGRTQMMYGAIKDHSAVLNAMKRMGLCTSK